MRKITVQDIDLVYDLGEYLRWCRKIGIAANLAMSRKKTVDVVRAAGHQDIEKAYISET